LSTPSIPDAEPSSPRDLVGTTIAGKYVVKRRIGAGGMGAVYEGEHIELGKRVAIKVIESDAAQSEQLAARFRREARAASAVESEHIVQVFDVGRDETVGLFMVMEYLAGEDLATYLERSGGRLSIEEGASIVAQAARGLAKAHAAGVVHRDLKPANLFLTKREDDSTCVKVVDFGISKLQRRENDGKTQTLTREGSVVGTPVYMSPEQAQGLKVDERTDVWALGALAYEVLAGRPPYELLATYEQMIIQIVTKPVPSLLDTAPWVPGEVRAVIERALRHDIATRTQDAATFARDLADAANVLPFIVSSPRLPTAFEGPPSTREVIVAPVSPSPPTATDLVVQAKTELDLSPPARRGRGGLIAAGLFALGALAAIAGAIAWNRIETTSALGGPAPSAVTPANGALVAPAASSLAGSPSAAASVAPASSDSAAPDASVVASAQPSASPRVALPRRPVVRPAAPVVPSARTGQYGAAGVSTSY
jgi:serine/threonine-protein kinase